MQGHRQITDAYLIMLADFHEGDLATLDRKIINALAGSESFRIDSCEEIALVYREYKDGATVEKERSPACRRREAYAVPLESPGPAGAFAIDTIL